jgi:hypothetical protein
MNAALNIAFGAVLGAVAVASIAYGTLSWKSTPSYFQGPSTSPCLPTGVQGASPPAIDTFNLPPDISAWGRP